MGTMWNDFLIIGIPAMDEQHRGIFAMIANLDDLLPSLKSDPGNIITKGKVRAVIDGLIDFLNVHFEEEETLMHENGFSEIDEHRGDHIQIMSKIHDHVDHMDTASFESVAALHRYLCHWLANHIAREDKKYARFVKQAN